MIRTVYFGWICSPPLIDFFFQILQAVKSDHLNNGGPGFNNKKSDENLQLHLARPEEDEKGLLPSWDTDSLKDNQM